MVVSKVIVDRSFAVVALSVDILTDKGVDASVDSEDIKPVEFDSVVIGDMVVETNVDESVNVEGIIVDSNVDESVSIDDISVEINVDESVDTDNRLVSVAPVESVKVEILSTVEDEVWKSVVAVPATVESLVDIRCMSGVFEPSVGSDVGIVSVIDPVILCGDIGGLGEGGG